MANASSCGRAGGGIIEGNQIGGVKRIKAVAIQRRGPQTEALLKSLTNSHPPAISSPRQRLDMAHLDRCQQRRDFRLAAASRKRGIAARQRAIQSRPSAISILIRSCETLVACRPRQRPASSGGEPSVLEEITGSASVIIGKAANQHLERQPPAIAMHAVGESAYESTRLIRRAAHLALC